MENRDDRYFTFYELESFSSLSDNYKSIHYLTGAGDANNGAANTSAMGFGRFVRFRTYNLTSGMTIDFDVRALARAR